MPIWVQKPQPIWKSDIQFLVFARLDPAHMAASGQSHMADGALKASFLHSGETRRVFSARGALKASGMVTALGEGQNKMIRLSGQSGGEY